MYPRLIATIWLSAALVLRAAAQPVAGDVKAIGFSAGVQTKYIVRYGQWTPVLAELTAQTARPFQGSLRLQRPDLDGDLVDFVERPLVLTPDQGLRRVWGYVVIFPDTTQQTLTLDVLADDGALVNRLNVPNFESIAADAQLILDVSQPAVAALDSLETSGSGSASDFIAGQQTFQRPIIVGRMPAADLPDRWFGLEAVNVLVWDDPKPATLQSTQIDALIRWVKNGGQLVLGIGGNWPALQNSALAEILPIAGDQPSAEVQTLPRYMATLAAPEEKRFPAPIVVCTARARPGAVWMFRDLVHVNGPAGLEQRTIDLIAAMPVGSGRVVTCAARLRDLLSVPARLARDSAKPQLLHELLDLNATSATFRASEAELLGSGLHLPTALFPRWAEPIDFVQFGSLLVLAASGFVSAYIVLSTLVSWWWLKRHSLTHLSWTLFAGFAVAGSVVSLGAVALSRGFSRLDSVSLVDLEAGAKTARGACFFGYRSAGRERVLLSLPGDGTYLRALARRQGQPTYATPLRYEALSARAELADTPVRATLKQFEGYWTGELDGTIRANLTLDRSSGRVTPESWIVNELPVALQGGVLLYLDPRLEGAQARMVHKAAGVTETHRRTRPVPPAMNVLAVEVPAINGGQQVRGIGAVDYEQLDARLMPAWERDPKPETRPDLPTLWERQAGNWVQRLTPTAVGVGGVTGYDGAWLAGLLISTRDLYLHTQRNSYSRAGTTINLDGLVERDISHWLLRGYGVLILRADRPGPARLHREGKPLETRRGLTLYRVRVPLSYSGVRAFTPPDPAEQDAAAESAETPAGESSP